MWRYQSPGFEALFMAALQRQQRCSQYCDTVLRAQDVSVPVHGCVLSTLSPLLSYELSAALPPPSGQSRLLEFQAFGPRTLLRLVDLLYSGEMAGEGEGAREEAMAAAAMLGIHGLEEVGRGEEAEGGARRRESGAGPGTAGGGRGREEEAAATEAGSQTEPPRYGEVPTAGEGSGEREAEGRRRELGESDAEGVEEPAERDAHAGTPTPDRNFSHQPLCVGPEEPEHPHTPSPSTSTSALNPDLVTSHAASAMPVAPHVDDVAGALQGTAAPPPDPVAPTTVPDHIPYISLSQLLLLPPDGHHDANQSTGPTPFYILPASLSPSLIPSAAALSEQVTEVLPTFPFDPPQAWEEPGGSPAPGDGDEFEQFEDNIPGFISYFLNQPQEEGQRGRRGTRRRAAGGGARRGRGEKRARRPRVDPGVRGEGAGAAAAVKQAEVVSQRGRLTSWGLRASRTGRGGGAAGRKVCLKTRELCRKRRRQTTRRGAAGVGEEGRGRAPRRAARRTARGRGQQQNALPQLSQEGFPLIKTQSPRDRPLPFPALPRQLYRALTYDPQSHSPGPAHPLAPDPSPSPSPAPGPFLAPAPALLYTAPLPSPSQDGYPEPLDRLLEDIMMGLDIPPTDAAGAPPPRGDGDLPSEGSSERRVATSPPGRQACVSDTRASAAAAGRPKVSGTGWSGGRDAAVPQTQTEGELSDILESFLQSFELRFTGATPGEMEDGDAVCFSQSYTALRNCAGAQAQTSPAQPTDKPSVDTASTHSATTHTANAHCSSTHKANAHSVSTHMANTQSSSTHVSTHSANTHSANTHSANTHSANMHTANTLSAITHTANTDSNTHSANTHMPNTDSATTHVPNTHTASTDSANTHTASTDCANTHTPNTHTPNTHSANTHTANLHSANTRTARTVLKHTVQESSSVTPRADTHYLLCLTHAEPVHLSLKREVEKRRRVTTRKARKRMSGSQQPVRKLRVRLSQPGAVEASEFPRGKRPLPAGRPTRAPERVKVQTVPPTERSEEDVRAGGAQTAGGTERGRDGARRKLFTPSEVRSAPGRSGGGEQTALNGRRRKREGRMTDVESETGRPKRRRAGAGPEPGQPVPDVPRPQASPGLELQIPGSADIKPPPGPARRGRGRPPSVLTPDGGRPPSVPTRGRGRPRAEHRAAGDGERRRAGRGHPTTPKKEPVSSEPRASPGLELQIPGSANTKPPPGPARRGRGRPPSDPTRGPRRPPSVPTRGRGRLPSIPTRGRGRLPSIPTPGVVPLPSVPTRGRGRPPSIPTRGRGRPRAERTAAGDGERRRAWTPKKEPASSELHIPASGGSGKGGVVTLEVDEDVEVVQVTTAGELETVRVVRRPLGRRADGERRRGGARGRARGRGRGRGGGGGGGEDRKWTKLCPREPEKMEERRRGGAQGRARGGGGGGGGGEDRKWTKLCPREPEQMEERRREEGVNGGSSSEEDIDVVATADSDDRASAVGEGYCQKRRVGERHPGIIKPPSPHPAPEVTEGSAGSCDEEEEDVDVLGSFCPSFFILGSDVTGGGSYYVPSVEPLL